MKLDSRCWAEIHLDHLEHNVKTIRSGLTDGCRLMAVVKANAYGHGDRELAPYLRQAGVDWLGVATLQEAEHLRQAGSDLPILVLGYTPPSLTHRLMELDVLQTVYSGEYARQLAAEVPPGRQLEVHLKVDTGMNRLGLHPEAADGLTQALEVYQNPRLRCTGIFTHFGVADELQEQSRAVTRGQFDAFVDFCNQLEQQGITPGLRHCCNSAATLLYPEMHLDMVRCGILLYGMPPAPALQNWAALRPVMSLHAPIVQLKEIPAGQGVSYGRAFVAPSPRRIATVPIGYADGYQRQLGGLASGLVRGAPAPVVGRVCMDYLMLDVTHLPQAQVGDRVTLVGTDGDRAITFEELAALTGTIGYERVCAVSLRVPRLYLREMGPASSSEDHCQPS